MTSGAATCGSPCHSRCSQLGRHGPGAGDDRLGARRTAAVAATDGFGQVDRRAAGGGRASRGGSGPCEDERVLALEEPMAADATGGASLARVLLEKRDLDRSRLRAGERGRRAAGRDDHRAGRLERPEPRDVVPGGQLDARHAATATTLRTDAGGAEVEQLGVRADEAQLLVAGAELHGTDDLVAVLEPDHVPLVPAE